MSETTIKPGEFAKPDPAALAQLGGDGAPGTAMVRADFNADGGYVPPEAKLYYETMDVAYGVGFAAVAGITSGSFCFGKKDVICGPKKPLNCIILGSEPYWREWKDYDPSEMARTWPTREAAVRDGMDPVGSPYGSGGPKANVGPAVQLAMLVQEPASGNTSMAFTLLLGGKRYAPARFRIAGTVFRCVERTLDTLAKRDASLRGALPAQGRLSRYVVQFSTEITVDAKGKTKTRLNLNAAVDAEGRALEVQKSFWDDFAEYSRQVQACDTGAAVSDEDGIPASDEPPVALAL